MPDHSTLLIFGGALLLYIAARAAMASLGVSPGQTLPGRRAIGHFIPIAMVVVAAAMAHQIDVALAVIFATSVGALSLATGAVIVTDVVERNADPAPPPPLMLRGWTLLLPAIIIVYLCGLRGHLGPQGATCLLIEGLLVLLLRIRPGGAEHLRRGTGSGDGPTTVAASRVSALNVLNLVLTIILAMVGARLAVAGTLSVTQQIHDAQPTLMATAVLGPILVVPMVLTGGSLPAGDRAWAASGIHVYVALLNLCGLLPLLIFAVAAVHAHAGSGGAELPFALVLWRVDAVVLILAALVLLPISQGKWALGAIEGVVLVMIYLAYVLAVLFVDIVARQ